MQAHNTSILFGLLRPYSSFGCQKFALYKLNLFFFCVKFFNCCSESDSRAAQSYSSFGCSHKTLSVQLLLLSHLNCSIVQNLTLGQHDNYDCACVPHDMKVVTKTKASIVQKEKQWIVNCNHQKIIAQFMNRSSMATTIATTIWTAFTIMTMR